jgi:hypothetical protein
VIYVGLDFHLPTISVAAVDARSKFVMQSILATPAAVIRQFLIFFASARPAIFAASWVAKPPSRFNVTLFEQRVS